MKKSVFFDRDGVLNELINRDGGLFSPQNINQFKVYNYAKKTISKLKEIGYLSIVISNQPDIKRGKLKKIDLDMMTEILFNKLLVDDVFYCVHDDDDNCICRKPYAGLLIKASEKWSLNLAKSYMVGDTWRDLEAANKAGVKFLLLNKKYNTDYSDVRRIEKLEDIVKIIRR